MRHGEKDDLSDPITMFVLQAFWLSLRSGIVWFGSADRSSLHSPDSRQGIKSSRVFVLQAKGSPSIPVFFSSVANKCHEQLSSSFIASPSESMLSWRGGAEAGGTHTISTDNSLSAANKDTRRPPSDDIVMDRQFYAIFHTIIQVVSNLKGEK